MCIVDYTGTVYTIHRYSGIIVEYVDKLNLNMLREQDQVAIII